MYLRSTRRIKDGKEHRYWSIVESKRCAGGRVVQRPVLYLGEINDSQREAWCRVIEGFDEGTQRSTQLALFPAERAVPEHAKAYGVQVRLEAMQLHRPRQWGACWLACQLYEQLGLDQFWAARLPNSREGTCWRHVLQTLVCYRLLDPGSEWRLHRQWFEASAMGDLLGADYALVGKNTLYRCLDKLLAHKPALFGHLRQRWQDLFGAQFEVLLYDLTRTYFESPPPEDDADKRRHGYSRDKRRDCVQVVIALVVTPDGFPLAYEVLPGNTADKTTLRAALHKIEAQYGKAQRGDGSRHSDRCGAHRDAAGRPADRLSGRHPQGAAQQDGESPAWPALAGGAAGGGRETAAAEPALGQRPEGGGTLRAGPQPRPHQQRARHAPAPVETAVEPAQGTLDHAPDPRRAGHEARCCPRQGAGGVAAGRGGGGPRECHLPLRAQS
jgi:hypothetical protein